VPYDAFPDASSVHLLILPQSGCLLNDNVVGLIASPFSSILDNVGAYGYNITLHNCTNNAATPVTNLTSGGSIKEWSGQALPSIADATGGQVLALKSDKSGLEFATVSGGGMDPIVASLIFG